MQYTIGLSRFISGISTYLLVTYYTYKRKCATPISIQFVLLLKIMDLFCVKTICEEYSNRNLIRNKWNRIRYQIMCALIVRVGQQKHVSTSILFDFFNAYDAIFNIFLFISEWNNIDLFHLLFNMGHIEFHFNHSLFTPTCVYLKFVRNPSYLMLTIVFFFI